MKKKIKGERRVESELKVGVELGGGVSWRSEKEHRSYVNGDIRKPVKIGKQESGGGWVKGKREEGRMGH